MTNKKRRLEDLAKLSKKELDSIFEKGTTPDIANLEGYEFRGYNVPFFARLIGIQKFKKGFFRKDGKPMGYNIKIVQDGIGKPWACKPSNENPKWFGFYTVKKVDQNSKDNKHPHAILLNYGEGNNPLWNGTWILRDYLVQVDPDNNDLYIGRAYIALGPLRFFSNYFILERDRRSPR